MLQKIYNLSSPGLQNVLISLYGYYWKWRRFGGGYAKFYNGFKERESYSYEQWRSYQTTKLREILVHSYNTVPFYEESFKEAGFNKNFLKSFELNDLKKLPFITKQDFRLFGQTTMLSKKRENNTIFLQSSGSTGTPTKILMSARNHRIVTAGNEVRVRNWASVNQHDPRGMIGGRRIVPDGMASPPFYRYNSAEKQVYFSPYHLTPKTVNNYHEAFEKYNISYLNGYAHSTFYMAKLFKEAGLKLPKLKAIISSSEMLTQEMRDLYAEVYGCKTFDAYSSVEACCLISECEYGNLHYSPDMGIVEFLNEDGKDAKPGELAEIVCTGLWNYSQPLIRYKMHDYAILSSKDQCECGRQMPIVGKIVGRLEDMVKTIDGRSFSYFYNVYVGIQGIKEAQLVQTSLKDFKVVINTDHGYDQRSEDVMVKRLKSQLGNEINVRFEYLDEIPRTVGGKFKSVISLVKE